MKEYSDYFYSQLVCVYSDTQTPVRNKYIELYRILNEVINKASESTGMVFSGPFARLTYISREYSLETTHYNRLNSFRCKCKELSEVDESVLEQNIGNDIYNLAILIEKITGVTVPDSLAKSKTHGDQVWQHRQNSKSYLRVSVTSCEGAFIHAVADDEEEETISIKFRNVNNFYGDWSYLAPLIQPGTQLNIIHPVKKEDYYLAELIIFEPDYLIDISSVASCFKEYGATPFNYLLKKFQPSVHTKHTLLGNFASQLLDEEINVPEDNSFKSSVTTFFRSSAISLVTCQDDIAFIREEGEKQRRNIHDIISKTPQNDQNFELDKMILEPSFFCEELGLQGRMDMLHMDFKVLLEQKSGKKEFQTGRHREEHYVQMLLYLAVLHYSFGVRNEEVSCYLLYSKYEDGLIKEGPAPKLLFEAFRLRNQIVWNEYNIGQKDGARQLNSLTPGRINSKGIATDFFRNWQLPEIVETLRTIQTAPPVEKDYFFRMFKFIQQEHILSKIGTPTKEGSGLASLWNCTLEEKRLAGIIYDDLRIDESALCDNCSQGVSMVCLTGNGEHADSLNNFRQGDIVVLYKYRKGEVPDARKGIVLRASIYEIQNNQIVIRLRSSQKNLGIFYQDDDTMWALEHDFLETSYGALYRGLYTFLQTDKYRRELILGQRMPERDESISLNGDYGQFNDLVLGAKQAKDYYIVIGPPGTGKTSFGLLNILKETLTDKSTSALLMSFTNRAVDEICSKLVKDNIPFIRIGSESSCPDVYKDYLLENVISECRNVAEIRNILVSSRVYVGTTTSVTSRLDIFTLKQFSLAIIDEASQILEPHLLPILSAHHDGKPAICKFVMIGDHKQLTAVVQQSIGMSRVDEESLHSIHLFNCRNSLFERLLSFQLPNESPYVYRLTCQGRMHTDVAQFSSRFFYEGKLKVVPLVHQESSIAFPIHDDSFEENLFATRRVAFVSVDKPAFTASAKVNSEEAKVIAKLVYGAWRLYRKNSRVFVADESIGVIVPYRNQITAIRNEIYKFEVEELNNITIDTVERYQGSERDIIIYGFTVQFPYQLDFLTNNVFNEQGMDIDRKLNVALTRAKEHNIVVGNPELLKQNSIFRKFIEEYAVL